MRWLIGLGLSALLLGAVILVVPVRQLPPTTTQAAIAAALEEQAIVHQRVQIVQGGCVPVREYCQAYVTEVVVLIAGYQHRGRVECVQVGVGCRLFVPSLDLHGVPLLDLVPAQGPWEQAIGRIWQHITAWFDRSL